MSELQTTTDNAPRRRRRTLAGTCRGASRGGNGLLRWLGVSAAGAAWLFALGLQWPVLQVVAWVKMAADYQARMGWAEAVEQAVAGPKCEICLALESAQAASEERDTPAQPAARDMSFVIGMPPAGDEGLEPPAGRWIWMMEDAPIESRRERPPAPPPRTAV